MLVDLLTKAEATVDNQAVLELIQSAKGSGASNESDQNICNDISNNISACKYIQSQQCCNNISACKYIQSRQCCNNISACKYIQSRQCCNNITNTNQSNTIKCMVGDMKDIIQSNDAAYQTCAVSSSIKMSDNLASTIINRSSAKAKQKAVGLDLTLVLIILGSIALLILGSPIIIGGTAITTLLKILGVIIIIAGIVFIVLYFFSIKKSKMITNSPVIYCGGAKSVPYIEKINTTYSGAKKHLDKNDDKNYGGFDFIIDLPEDPKKAKKVRIKDSSKGMALFFRDDDDIFDCGNKNKIDTTTTNLSKTFINGKKDSWKLAVGIALLISGILMMVFQLLTGKKSSKPQPSKFK